jgi:hypothetical protein
MNTKIYLSKINAMKRKDQDERTALRPLWTMYLES